MAAMVTILKFTASYIAALAATMFVLVVIGVLAFGSETLSASFAEYLIVSIVIALLALVPAILFVWAETRNEERVNTLRFGAYGLMTAFIESCILMWLAFDGDLASRLDFIVSLSLAGLFGGATIASVWNGLTAAIPAPNL